MHISERSMPMVFLLCKIMVPTEAVRMIAARKASMSQYTQGGKSSVRRSIMLTAIAVEDKPQMVMEANSCLLLTNRDTLTTLISMSTHTPLYGSHHRLRLTNK